MGRQIAIEENGVFLVLEILEQSGSAVLLHCQRAPFRPGTIIRKLRHDGLHIFNI